MLEYFVKPTVLKSVFIFIWAITHHQRILIPTRRSKIQTQCALYDEKCSKDLSNEHVNQIDPGYDIGGHVFVRWDSLSKEGVLKKCRLQKIQHKADATLQEKLITTKVYWLS